MAQSPDHPQLTFVEARKSNGDPMYTKGRPDGPPLWIVVHDMEFPERGDAAEWTGEYFSEGAGGRSVSSHYCCDSNSVVQCVLLADSAWTVGNRAGNNRGINWEFAGYASQTREQWLDDYGRAMFRQAAPIIREDAAEYRIPLRRCSIDDLKAFRPGVTSHNDLRLAFGKTTHTDPGPNFPWDVFLQIINEEEDGMFPYQVRWPNGAIFIVSGATAPSGKYVAIGVQFDTWEAHQSLNMKMVQLKKDNTGHELYEYETTPWPVGPAGPAGPALEPGDKVTMSVESFLPVE